MEARDAARLAGRFVGTGVKVKAAAIASVVFVVFLFIVGLFGAGIGGKAYADSCGDPGTPSVDYGDVDVDGDEPTAQQPDANQRNYQIANAKIIDGVAQNNGLSGRATLVGLMTALQESTLLNLPNGHADSVGLFQQRESQGWGSRGDIMKPKYAATMFFMGAKDGDPPGLTDIKGWEKMGLGEAAQAVQKSAHPELYDGEEDAAREIAKEAGLDLDRPAKDAGANEDQDQGDDTATDGGDGDDSAIECYPEDDNNGTGKPGKPGAAFHDGDAPWPSSVKNPRSTEAAIAWAESEAQTGGRDWYRACLAFVARAYGWSFSGVPYAIDHYREMPASMKHDKDRNPPPGALMYWETGGRAGHVAVYLGDGKIASNDILRPGYIDVVPATDIESKWGATYVGWAPPYFPKGG
ncbi:C40 family peptidase [Streptomyces marianii]|uniref:NlpC/P60 family protein n=1 Tax=Streptomyces marianii TaxID=1817406 RepID=A0A5R9DVW0_9ACTN|nr:NlpC/P60 family protein [Streptomyces marianii]TLQ38873.1 NlpC/P60 family protein [Streptomyces marianii]